MLVVIYLFLGTLRASVIPGVVVPISVLAAFAVMAPLGFSLNTARLAPDAARRALREIEERFGLPAVDPLRTGVAPLVDAMG